MRIKAYKCDQCGKVSEDATEFLEFAGNVMVPGKGGLIGQNIWDLHDPKQVKEHGRVKDFRELHLINKNMVITSETYCKYCAAKALGLLDIPAPEEDLFTDQPF